MFRETVISIIIIFSIIILDFVVRNYTKESIKETSTQLTQVKANIEENNGDIEKSVEKTIEIWKKKYNKLAYFIEHDELEKVNANLVDVKSYINIKDFDMAITSINETEFSLKHIEDKIGFNLVNIF